MRAARAAQPGIGRATVYRALRRLQAEGRIERYEDGYGLPDRRDDHHHLVCIECGRTTIPSLEETERALRRAIARTGYRLLAHELVITGFCERHAA